MSRVTVLKHQFVEFIPETVEEGTVYISLTYATVVHKCCCGCGSEVVTPLSPTDWTLSFDGRSISLDPSIGNWSFPCQSHYWIKKNKVTWAPRWTPGQVTAGRTHDSSLKQEYFDTVEITSTVPSTPDEKKDESENKFWHRVRKWFTG